MSFYGLPSFALDAAPALVIPDTAEEMVHQITTKACDWHAFVKQYFVLAHQSKDQYITAEEQIIRLRIQHEEDKSSIDQLATQLSASTTQIKLLESKLALASSNALSDPQVKPALSEKLPDPPMFSGGREELSGWIAALRLKLSLNADRFPTPKSQVGYAIGRTEGKAMAQILHHVQSDGNVTFVTLEELLDYLKTAFGDPDERATAQLKLEHYAQKNLAFSEYYGEFRRLAAMAGLEGEAKRIFLLRGINDELRAYLRNNSPAESFEDLAKQLQKADTLHTQWAPLRPSRPQITVSRPTPNATKNAVSPNSVSPSVTQYTPPPTPPVGGGEPMDLSRQRFHISEEEKLRRVREHLCYYCGGSGHQSRGCPAKTQSTRLRELVLPSDSVSNVPSRVPSPSTVLSGNDQSPLSVASGENQRG